MSSPMELVHLAADSPLVSWRDRDLKFFQAPYMHQGSHRGHTLTLGVGLEGIT